MFGSPSSIHSDRGTQFESKKLKFFLRKNDIIKTRTTPYAPWANGQCEKMNGSLQKTINLCLRTLNLDKDNWEKVLPMTLSSMRALLCKSTNETPHSRLLNFQRHSMKGTEIPDFLIRPDSTILHKQHIRNKGDPLVEKVILRETISPYFARVDFENGRRETVSTRNLAPYVSEIGVKTSEEEKKTTNEQKQIISIKRKIMKKQKSKTNTKISKAMNTTKQTRATTTKRGL